MSGRGSPSRPVKPGREDADRALAGTRQAEALELGDDVGQGVVVEALAGDVVGRSVTPSFS